MEALCFLRVSVTVALVVPSRLTERRCKCVDRYGGKHAHRPHPSWPGVLDVCDLVSVWHLGEIGIGRSFKFKCCLRSLPYYSMDQLAAAFPPLVVTASACVFCRRPQVGETFVASSGTTTDLETYDFDYKTSSIEISAVFSEPGQSITIAEVRAAVQHTCAGHRATRTRDGERPTTSRPVISFFSRWLTLRGSGRRQAK